jgi:tetratricopeptide (TPR) repeat protein
VEVIFLNDFDRAIEELTLGNYSEGMVILQKLLQDDPDNVDILYNLGMCYSEMGVLSKSIELLEKSAELAPDHANTLVALGFSYFSQGSDEKAMEVLIKALVLEPDNYYALKNIGSLYNKQGEPYKALDSFKKADKSKPGSPDVLLGLGHTYEVLSDFKMAAVYYNRVKQSGATEVIVEKAVKGLNRIAVSQAKPEGQESSDDVVMCLLKAIETFANMGTEKVKEIAFEAAMVGTNGLSINDPEKQYKLESMEGKFSGMQLLCFMFAGFKIIDNSLPPVADLETEYKAALKLYRRKLDGH